MKAALLISGYLRSFKENLSSINDFIIKKFDEVDVYIHITKNENNNDKYLNPKDLDIEYLINIFNPKILIVEDNKNYNDENSINNVFNLWSKYHKLNYFKNLNEKIEGNYDIVIKYRPDMNLISDNIFVDKLEDIIYIPEQSYFDKSKLNNSNAKYICDIFAYGKSEIMNKYFDIYSNLDKLINNFGTVSETLLFNYLKEINLKYKLLPIEYNMILSKCNIFAIAGDSGSGKTTLGNILKKYFSNSFMLECDRYHKWERKDENWKKITHLNPEANFLMKMHEDIFDLKIGKTIYQVDYDHSSGKFTEPEKIKSSDNIVVCGLHSLYNQNENIYNLKIFIDTDDTLKYTWKIKRDIIKRGYSKEDILNQIESRKEDYIKYILPQRDKSDVIINFFTEEFFDINDLDKKIDIKLRILINRKFNISNILGKLIENNITFDYNSNEFHEIIFDKYQPIELDRKIFNGNYYDYILFFILNL